MKNLTVRDYRYIIPNGVTSIGLTIGLVAIFLTLKGHYVDAAWILLLCVLLDKLDGSLARLLDAGSAIGMQLDSFSDFVTFCVAPGILAGALMTQEGSPLSAFPSALMAYASVVVYVISGALRLARFNTIEDSGEGLKAFFSGVPTTLCGALIMTALLTLNEHVLFIRYVLWLPALLVLCGLLMNSPVYLPKLSKRPRYRVILWFQVFNFLVAPVLVIGHWFPEYLLSLVLVYVVVGLAWANRPGVDIQ